MEEQVILVDSSNKEIGVAEKIKTHREGKLHRAFSIFVFNSEGQLLLQKRAQSKYHSGGLWSNTCCSHPRPEEPTAHAAHRRLKEEMGFDCELKEIFSFTYKVTFDNDLTEHEYDHVFLGTFAGDPTPCPEDVDEWKWIDLGELQEDVREHPERYTYWLQISLDEIVWHVEQEWQISQGRSR